MTADPIADPQSLPGRRLHDGLGRKLGEVEDVIEAEEGDTPKWVKVKVKPGAFGSVTVLIPVARIKEDNDRLEVPYSTRYLLDSPQPEDPDDMSEEDEKTLLTYLGVERGDQPDVDSYSTQGTQEVDLDAIEEPVGDPEEEGQEADNADRSEPADSEGDGETDENEEAEGAHREE